METFENRCKLESDSKIVTKLAHNTI